MARERRSEIVVADLMGKIARRELIDGQKLPTEVEMAAHYGAGRSTIREAMQTLAAKGLIIARHGSGMLVAPADQWSSMDPDLIEVRLGDDRFERLIEARTVIEPSIASLAAIRATDDDIAQMQQILARHESIDPENRDEHARTDIEFHAALARASHNPVLESVHASLTGLGRELRYASARVPGAVERAITWHEHVLDALRHRDPTAVESAMQLHMRQVRREFERLKDELAAAASSGEGTGEPRVG